MQEDKIKPILFNILQSSKKLKTFKAIHIAIHMSLVKTYPARTKKSFSYRFIIGGIKVDVEK